MTTRLKPQLLPRTSWFSFWRKTNSFVYNRDVSLEEAVDVQVTDTLLKFTDCETANFMTLIQPFRATSARALLFMFTSHSRLHVVLVYQIVLAPSTVPARRIGLRMRPFFVGVLHSRLHSWLNPSPSSITPRISCGPTLEPSMTGS